MANGIYNQDCSDVIKAFVASRSLLVLELLRLKGHQVVWRSQPILKRYAARVATFLEIA